MSYLSFQSVYGVYELPSRKYLWSTVLTCMFSCFHFSPTDLTLEPQLPDKDFREKSEQPASSSEHAQTSCRVLAGDTSDEVQVNDNNINGVIICQLK